MIKKHTKTLLMFLLFSVAASAVHAQAPDQQIEEIKVHIRKELQRNQWHRKVVIGAAVCGVGVSSWYLFFKPLPVKNIVLPALPVPVPAATPEGVPLTEEERNVVRGLLKQAGDKNKRILGGVRDFLWDNASYILLQSGVTVAAKYGIDATLKYYNKFDNSIDAIFHDGNLKWYDATHSHIMHTQQPNAAAPTIADLLEVDKPKTAQSDGWLFVLQENKKNPSFFNATWQTSQECFMSVIAFMEVRIEDLAQKHDNVTALTNAKEAAYKALTTFDAVCQAGNGPAAFDDFKESFKAAFSGFSRAERLLSL